MLDALRQAIELVGGEAFVRLGSRSAKDSFRAECRGLRVQTATEALEMLTSGSERVTYDLKLALRNGYQPSIFVRTWLTIPPWTEFRCFIKNRRLVGISQYDCTNLGRSPDIAKNQLRIQQAIQLFMTRFIDSLHVADTVADVIVHDQDPLNEMTVTLLELNPWLPVTDACLFDWRNELDFDQSFRFLHL